MKNNQDRRLKIRQKTNKEIHYRTANMAEFEKGRMYDLSHVGALFTSQRDIPLNTKIQISISAESPEVPGIRLLATIIRKQCHQTRFRQFEYGCRFNYRYADERRPFTTRIKYRIAEMNCFEEGLSWNLSNKGILFSSDRELQINKPVHLVIPLEDPQKPPLQVIAHIVRKEVHQMRRRRFGYGCQFQQPVDID